MYVHSYNMKNIIQHRNKYLRLSKQNIVQHREQHFNSNEVDSIITQILNSYCYHISLL